LIAGLMFSTSNPRLFYLQFIAIGVAGALPSGMIYAQILAERFEAHRGLWIGIAGGVGNGLGAALLPLLAGALLLTVGWRGSFAVIALIILLIGLPLQCWLIPAERPSAAERIEARRPDPSLEGMDAWTALRQPSFWLLASALPLGGGSLIGLFSMLVPITMARGYSLDSATMAVAVFALVCTLWEPAVGFILDRTTRPRVLAPCYWIAALGIVLLLRTHSTPLLALSAVMLAVGLGAEPSALSFLLSRYFGRRALGTISGIAFAIMLSSAALLMVLFNAAYDAGSGYQRVVWLLVPLLLWNGIAMFWIGRYPFNVPADT
jgi:MFS family permease